MVKVLFTHWITLHCSTPTWQPQKRCARKIKSESMCVFMHMHVTGCFVLNVAHNVQLPPCFTWTGLYHFKFLLTMFLPKHVTIFNKVLHTRTTRHTENNNTTSTIKNWVNFTSNSQGYTLQASLTEWVCTYMYIEHRWSRHTLTMYMYAC